MHPVVRAILQGGGYAPSASMRISTSTTGTDYCYYIKTAIINGTKVTVVEGIIKGETSGSGNEASGSIGISNGARRTKMAVKNGSVICDSGGSAPYTHTVDTTTADITCKIKLNGTTNAEFYVNEVLVYTLPYASMTVDASNYIAFGDMTNVANCGGSTLWRSLKYYLDYVGAPATFTEWAPVSKPDSQGWTLTGTDLATIVVV